jgi:hypothetical protein
VHRLLQVLATVLGTMAQNVINDFTFCMRHVILAQEYEWRDCHVLVVVASDLRTKCGRRIVEKVHPPHWDRAGCAFAELDVFADLPSLTRDAFGHFFFLPFSPMKR